MQHKTLVFKWLFERYTCIKFSVTGQDSSQQSPTISYRQPLWAIATAQETR
jgi:hypothetical protein